MAKPKNKVDDPGSGSVENALLQVLGEILAAQKRVADAVLELKDDLADTKAGVAALEEQLESTGERINKFLPEPDHANPFGDRKTLPELFKSFEDGVEKLDTFDEDNLTENIAEQTREAVAEAVRELETRGHIFCVVCRDRRARGESG